MVEVFSTNVENHKQADFLLHQLGLIFLEYEINFDLEDCDKILRVESVVDIIETVQIVTLLKDLGFDAQVLPDSPLYSKESVPAANLEIKSHHLT